MNEFRELWEVSLHENVRLLERGVHIHHALVAILYNPVSSRYTLQIADLDVTRTYVHTYREMEDLLEVWDFFAFGDLSEDCYRRWQEVTA